MCEDTDRTHSKNNISKKIINVETQLTPVARTRGTVKGKNMTREKGWRKGQLKGEECTPLGLGGSD